MEFYPLTEEQRTQFETQGFLIVRQAIDQAMVQRLISAGDTLVTSDQQENRQATANGIYDGFRNCIALDETFLELLTYGKTVALVTQLLGPRIHLVTSHLIYKQPNSPDTPKTYRQPGWHQDGGNMAHDLGMIHVPRVMIKCAYYLSDISQPNSGVTLFAPGSHRWQGEPPIPRGADPEHFVEPLLQPGDAVLFENRVYHAGAVNLTNQQCKVLMMGYGYQWFKPFDYIQQPVELLERVDDIGKQLLGGLRDAQGHFIPGGISTPLTNWHKQYITA